MSAVNEAPRISYFPFALAVNATALFRLKILTEKFPANDYGNLIYIYTLSSIALYVLAPGINEGIILSVIDEADSKSFVNWRRTSRNLVSISAPIWFLVLIMMYSLLASSIILAAIYSIYTISNVIFILMSAVARGKDRLSEVTFTCFIRSMLTFIPVLFLPKSILSLEFLLILDASINVITCLFLYYKFLPFEVNGVCLTFRHFFTLGKYYSFSAGLRNVLFGMDKFFLKFVMSSFDFGNYCKLWIFINIALAANGIVGGWLQQRIMKVEDFDDLLRRHILRYTMLVGFVAITVALTFTFSSKVHALITDIFPFCKDLPGAYIWFILSGLFTFCSFFDVILTKLGFAKKYLYLNLHYIAVLAVIYYIHLYRSWDVSPLYFSKVLFFAFFGIFMTNVLFFGFMIRRRLNADNC